MKDIVLPALGTFASDFAKNVVKGESLSEAAQGALTNLIFDYLPKKYLGHKLSESKSYLIYFFLAVNC